MWGSCAADANRHTPPFSGASAIRKCMTLRPLPRLKRAHFPFALLLLACLALKPGLRAAGHKARQEIAARLSVLGIGRRNRSYGASRTSGRIFPRHAGVFFATAEHGGDCGPRVGKVGRG